MYSGMIVSAVAFVAGFAMAFPIYKDDAPKAVVADKTDTASDIAAGVVQNETQTVIKREILKSPLEGELVALSDVPDEVFSSGGRPTFAGSSKRNFILFH